MGVCPQGVGTVRRMPARGRAGRGGPVEAAVRAVRGRGCGPGVAGTRDPTAHGLEAASVRSGRGRDPPTPGPGWRGCAEERGPQRMSIRRDIAWQLDITVPVARRRCGRGAELTVIIPPAGA
ncbi:hypothetical protein SDC9_98490 [bioreactor metagenome]|uniref:Uncharacterized protein n=1 Tax=bioreactor metagenome TaxID=1076179 RepID=A0A645AEY8_9ZZZZ